MAQKQLLLLLVALVVLALGIGCGGEEKTTIALPPPNPGKVDFEKFDGGWRIELDATGLPRLDGTRFYQAWLGDGETLVSVGTFNEPEDVTLWAGVSPVEFPEFTVTRMDLTDPSTVTSEPVLRAEFELP